MADVELPNAEEARYGEEKKEIEREARKLELERDHYPQGNAIDF